MSYTDPIYTSYANATFYEPNPNGDGEFVTYTGDAFGNQIVYSGEALGFTQRQLYLPHSRRWISALSAIENYHSGAHYDPQGLLVAPSYSVVNASLNPTLPNDNWNVKLRATI